MPWRRETLVTADVSRLSGQILRVGSQMEPINPALVAPDNKRIEVGLPILVSVPPGIQLLPGEHVKLFIEVASPKH